MEHQIIKCGKLNTSIWPGGTTTQLFIFPPGTSYQERNFQFRLSTATVELEKSVFTSLPGVSRKLMILDGAITIIHEDHYSKQLNKFDTDSFEGDWKTSSIGTCTDFNLMTSGKLSGELKSVVIDKTSSYNYKTDENLHWIFMYVYSGSVNTQINNKMIILDKGDLLVVKYPGKIELAIEGNRNSELVLVEIPVSK